jgi:type II secretory pathway pseudopilin PulG
MYCTGCGATLAHGVRFCAGCGAPVDGDATSLPVARTRPTVVAALAVLKILAGSLWFVMAGLCAISSSLPQRASPVFAAGAVVLFGLSVLCFACAYGLWTLKPFGRVLQIVLSCVGIVIGFPLGSVISVLILVYMFTPGIKILFSGRAPETLGPEELAHLRSSQRLGKGVAIAVAAAVAVLIIPMAGIIAAIAIPNFLNAVDRGKQKRTMADARLIAHAMEAYSGEHDGYPIADSADALGAQLAPKYLTTMPRVDGWTHPFQVASSGSSYTLYSFGKDGTGSSCEPAVTTTYNDQICMIDGQFVRYPSGPKP